MYDQEWYVYILECRDNSYYTGITNDMSARYEQHLSGLGSKYTKIHGVKKLAHLELYSDLDSAKIREKQIKGWRREKKEMLISGNWQQYGCFTKETRNPSTGSGKLRVLTKYQHD